MGFLDELKQKAEQTKHERGEAAGTAHENTYLVNEKLDRIFHYFRELSEQLAVIEPPTPLVFPLQGIGDISGLKLGNFYPDYRRKKQGNDFSDLIDYVTLTFTYASPQKFVFDRQEPWQVERLREYLGRYAFKFELEEKKNAQSLIETVTFTIPWEVRALVHVRGDTANRRIIFITRNVERLGEQEFVFSVEKVDEAVLDEFARFMMGQPNRFRLMQ